MDNVKIKKHLNSRDCAVVLGMFETGLGVARSLGQNGVTVIGVDFKKDVGFLSRYVKPMICPHPIQTDERFIRWLMTTFKSNKKIPLFLTSDQFLSTVSNNVDTLKKQFVFNLPSQELINNISDKYEQYKLAKNIDIPVPASFLLNTVEDLNDLLEIDVKYPLIIKGHEVTIWRSKISSKVKGFIANDEKELQEKTSFILAQNVSCLVQEVILGPDTNHVKYNCYMDSNGNIIAEFMLRKIRQYPIRFGVGSVVESIYDPNLLDVGRQLFSGIGYSGVGSAEFKYDERDKKFKLIEINPRYWQQNYITTASKLNFAYINYCDLLSLPLPNVDSYELGVKWVNIYMDLFSYLDYNKEGSLSLNQWLTSLKGKKTWSDFVVHDPLPVFHEIKKNLAKLFNPSKLQNLIKKCSKK